MKQIAKKLVQVMAECAYVQKSGTNDFHRYKYATAADVLEKVNASLVKHGVAVTAQAELIDLRMIWPWDRDAVLRSCVRTRRLLVVHEAVQVAGYGAEIAAAVAEDTGCRVARLGAPRIPVGYAPMLEAEARLSPEKVAAAASGLLRRKTG